MGVTIDETGRYIRHIDAKCLNCIFYTITNRECRRRAPVTGKGWPLMQPSDWCGEYEQRPNADCRSRQS